MDPHFSIAISKLASHLMGTGIGGGSSDGLTSLNFLEYDLQNISNQILVIFL